MTENLQIYGICPENPEFIRIVPMKPAQLQSLNLKSGDVQWQMNCPVNSNHNHSGPIVAVSFAGSHPESAIGSGKEMAYQQAEKLLKTALEVRVNQIK